MQKIAAAASAWLEKSGLKARLAPQIARYKGLDDEKKKQVLTGLVFALVAANLLLILAPLMTSFLDIHQKTQKVSSELTLAKKDIAAKEQMVKALASTQQSLQDTEKRIFESGEVHQFLDVLSGIAKESKIKIESLTPVPVEAKAGSLPWPLPKGYSLAGFELAGQAGYHEFAQFIDRLESGTRFVRVDSIDILHEESDNRRMHVIKLRFLLIRRD